MKKLSEEHKRKIGDAHRGEKNHNWKGGIDVNKRQREYYFRLRLIALQKYSTEIPFCACCGEKHIEFLTLDHINGDGAEHRRLLKRNGSRIYVWMMQQGYPQGFQVLCHNCNIAKGVDKICPHKGAIIKLSN